MNPRKLAAKQRSDVCAQCHLSGDVRIERIGRSQLDFRASEELASYSVAYVRGDSSGRGRVTSHVENLAQSQCKRASGSSLWCGTCHDPHSVPDEAQKTDWYRSKCLTCHTAERCQAPASKRAARGGDCISCHMPPAPAVDAQHVIYTDHSIPRKPETTRLAPDREAELVPFDGANLDTRDAGLAYAVLAVREGIGTYRERAFDLLSKAQQESPGEPQTLSYLADLYKTRGNDAQAKSLYQKLLKIDPHQLSALVALGGYAMEERQDELALAYWNEALQGNPALVLVRVNMALLFLRAGKRNEAEAMLTQALFFNPALESARTLLESLRSGPIR